MNIFFKILGWFFTLLFLFSAIIQYNDPDPIIWIVIYVLAAAISVGFTLNKIGPLVPLVAGFIGILGFIYVFPEHFSGFEFQKGMINKDVEEGREAFGLLIVSVVMFVYAIRIKLKKGY